MGTTKVMYLQAVYKENEKQVEFNTLDRHTVFRVSYESGAAVPITEYINQQPVVNCWFFGTGKMLIRKISIKDERGRYFVRKLKVRNGDYFRTTLTIASDATAVISRIRQYNNGSINDQIELSCQEAGILHVYKREMLPIVNMGPDDQVYDNPEKGYSIVYNAKINAFDLYVDRQYRKDLTELLGLVNVTLPYRRFKNEWGNDAGRWVMCAPTFHHYKDYNGKWRCF